MAVGLVTVGIITAILGNITINVGLTLQKLVHNKIAKLEEESDKPLENVSYVRFKVWWLGIILMLSGEIGNFLAFGLAPTSVVSPLGAIGIVANAILAIVVLKEKFRKRDIIGCFVVIGGTIAFVMNAPTTDCLRNDADVWVHMCNNGTAMNATLGSCWCICNYHNQTDLDEHFFGLNELSAHCSVTLEELRKDFGEPVFQVFMVAVAIMTAIFFVLGRDPKKEYTGKFLAIVNRLPGSLRRFMFRMAPVFLWGKGLAKRYVAINLMLCALLGSYTVVSLKAVSSLFIGAAGNTAGEPAASPFIAPELYLCIILAGISGALQIRYLQAAMESFGNSEVVPVYYVLFTLATMGAGTIMYKEYYYPHQEFSIWQILNPIFFTLGLIVTFAGVYMITANRDRKVKISSDRSDEANLLDEEDNDEESGERDSQEESPETDEGTKTLLTDKEKAVEVLDMKEVHAKLVDHENGVTRANRQDSGGFKPRRSQRSSLEFKRQRSRAASGDEFRARKNSRTVDLDLREQGFLAMNTSVFSGISVSSVRDALVRKRGISEEEERAEGIELAEIDKRPVLSAPETRRETTGDHFAHALKEEKEEKRSGAKHVSVPDQI